MEEHHKCPKCGRIMLKVVFQGHNLGYDKYLICINATQLRCLRCNVVQDNVTGGLRCAIEERFIHIHKLYRTSYTGIDFLSIGEDRIDGTDYLFQGDRA